MVVRGRGGPRVGGSPSEFFDTVRDYRLSDDLLAQITCPILLTDPDNEQFWPGQTHQLAEKVTHAEATTIGFTEAEGADGHIEPAAAAIRGERIFDWLDDQIPAGHGPRSATPDPELSRV